MAMMGGEGRLVVLGVLALLAVGCTTVSELVEIEQFPRDTAISIGERNYLINTFKCSEIRAINLAGVLECYATDGTKSVPISPASTFQMGLFEDQFEFEWGSEEHQAFLYEFHYLGGKERLASSLIGAVRAVMSTIDVIDAMNSTYYESNELVTILPQYRNTEALIGMSAWDLRGFSIADWHLNNSTFFQINDRITFNQGGINSQRIGDIEFHSNGVRSYYFGDSIYSSNGATTRRIGDTFTASSDGTVCTIIMEITRCRPH